MNWGVCKNLLCAANDALLWQRLAVFFVNLMDYEMRKEVRNDGSKSAYCSVRSYAVFVKISSGLFWRREF